MNVSSVPNPETACRRVQKWRLRRTILYLHDAGAVAVAVLAASIGSWLPLTAALLSLSGSLAYRYLDAFRKADLRDLRAAGPLLTPDERGRALACLGVRDAAARAENTDLEDLRRYLRDLPGGIRRG